MKGNDKVLEYMKMAKVRSVVLAVAAVSAFSHHAIAEVELPVVPVSDLARGNQVDLASDEDAAPGQSEQQGFDSSKLPAIPVVSGSVLRNDVPSAKPLGKGQKVAEITSIEDEEPSGPAYKTTRNVIDAVPGENQLVNVSMGHPNRIVTPFSDPKVLKLDKDALVTVKENVVYFASDKSTPVTLYIREAGDENLAVSLTMIPQKIPPRELFIKLPESAYMAAGGFGSKKAEQWEKSQPYEKTLTDLLRAIALGDVPQGYAVRNRSSAEPAPLCNQRGLRFDFSDAQMIDGQKFKAVVGVVSNLADQPIEFVETNCASRNVAAVAAFPHVYLEPGQKAEVYVVLKDGVEKSRGKKRKSLLGSR
ncbi:TraK domain-containing protein [Hydrocarboniclastica marina]|uniref:Conjugal transfer protein TraK n=1 Tax=Hydrocarboniclastica marina TaxID=2259620 RepID=A0A4P7XMW2_9ALTE|nr:type-F conjugative transfer system secretin TraK [Hydrocarboniclastica marina]QCF28134.1 conjugal transfer protein TraK [Hydrocarboniclastica marina]